MAQIDPRLCDCRHQMSQFLCSPMTCGHTVGRIEFNYPQTEVTISKEAPRVKLPTLRKVSEVVADIIDERARQDRLKTEGRFLYTAADPQLTDAEKFVMLTEEFGEVAREIQSLSGSVTDGSKSLEAAYKELVQVAAISVAWLESMKERLDEQK